MFGVSTTGFWKARDRGPASTAFPQTQGRPFVVVLSGIVERRLPTGDTSIDEELSLPSIVSESLTAETNDGAWGKFREAPRWLLET